MSIGPFFLSNDVLRVVRNAIHDPSALSATGPEKNYYDPDRVYRVSGRTAHLEVKGVLSQDPMPMAMYWGGGNTTYNQLIAALGRAESDPNIDEIEIDLDSPGGTVAGLFALLDRMDQVEKSIRVVGFNRVQSAAYAIAAKADEFLLANSAVAVGSIGIAADFLVRDDVVSVVSSNAPDKRPDVQTDEGRSVVRAELDEYEDLFIEAVAGGRGVTASTVRSEFGRGRTFLSAEAIKRGMADGLLNDNRTAQTGGEKGGAIAMDLEKLKAEHPAVYNAAVKIGLDQGVEQERERCTAHLDLSKASGGYDIAVEAITGGKGCTDGVIAKHTALKLSADVRADRANDNQSTAAATATGEDNQHRADDQPDNVEAFGLDVADLVLAKHGVKAEG